MKNLGLFLILALSASFYSCSDGQDPEKQPENIKPLKLNGYEIIVGYAGIDKEDMGIEVLSGNGDYSLVFPKYMTVAGEKIPYQDYKSLFLFHIDESDKIVIDFLWSDPDPQPGHENDVATGMLMVKDGSGQRKIIGINYYPSAPHVVGGSPDANYEGSEDPGKEYWVNY